MSESNHVSPETCECRKQAAPAESALPLSYARTLSWLSLEVILLTRGGLSCLISLSARETLLSRLYDFSRLVAYSTKKEDVGRAGLSPPNLDDVLHGAAPKSEIISSIPAWQAPFRVPLREGTFVLRVLYPLRGEPLRPGEDAPVMGALELTQDITGDYEQVLAFQGIIVVMCLLSSVVLFGPVSYTHLTLPTTSRV